MQERMNELQGEMAKALEIDEIKDVTLADRDFIEWLADKNFEDLSVEQKRMAEAYFSNAHEGLAVRPKNPTNMVKKIMDLEAAKKATADAQARQDEKKVVHFMHYDAHGQFGGGVYCSCGMRKIHNRGKVLARWADKHFEKYGHYWKRT